MTEHRLKFIGCDKEFFDIVEGMQARIAELEAATSPEATQRHYMRGYNAANARRRRYYVAERDTLSRIVDTLSADNRRLEVERDRLKAALRPFALAADVTDDLAAGIGLDEIMSSLSVGDLRRARAAHLARE